MDITRLVPDETGMVSWPTPSVDRKAIVTVGVFDGMHKGHQAVIGRTVELARDNDSFSIVVMFDRRPAAVHAWAKAHNGEDMPENMIDPQALWGVDERLRVCEELGVDHVMVVHYTLPFAAKSYRFFLGQMVGKLGMRGLVLGKDAQMGANREGDVQAIANLAAATGVFELEIVDDRGPGETRVPAVIVPKSPSGEGEPSDPLAGMNKAERRAWSKRNQAKAARVWSSTNVRYMLSQGRIKDANDVLGHPHSVEGVVVHGEERGRTIGFPTANLGDAIEGYLPVDGVYAGWLTDLSTAGDGIKLRRWPAAISIGTKPTFSEQTGLQERVVEAYAITEEWLDLYDHKVRVEFAGFLRPQIRFDTLNALTETLRANVEQTKQRTAES